MHSYHILFHFVMGAIKNKTLLKSQGKKGTSESQNQIDGWAQIQ